jgi:exodeoxyribonuclease III
MSKKLVSWNVNGIRAIIKKNFIADIQSLNPDVFCLQETKAAEDDVMTAAESFPDYHVYANSSKARKGYSGTAIFSKEEPIEVTYDMDMDEHDQEGRVITAEFADYFLVTAYCPNAGEGLARLDYRQQWDIEFTKYLTWLDKRKPVIVCGDLNVAHQPIDLARAKENYNASAGYTQQEIDGFNRLLNSGFIDSFRHFYPKEIKYSYWNNWQQSREKNIGWRIDYFLVSKRLMPHVNDAGIHNDKFGSDHCPVSMVIT